MKKSITIPLKDRIIRKEDLLRVSSLLWDIYQKNKTSHSGVTFTFVCEELDSTYEIENKDLKTEESFLDTKKIKRLSMRFYDYSIRNTINMDLSHGNSGPNALRIEGNDKSWVDAQYADFKELLESIHPQSNWFLKYQKQLYHLCSITAGSLALKLGSMLPHERVPPAETQPWLFIRQIPLSKYLLLGLASWVIGLMLMAWVFDKLRELWPSVEFDFGPEHMKKEKRMRNTLMVISTLLVVPIMLQILFWCLGL